jgi:hypothetical protein
VSRLISELESVLQQLVTEHARLLKLMDAQNSAMKTMDLPAIEMATRGQEASRLRIVGMDARRRQLSAQAWQAARLEGEPTLARLAAAYPGAAGRLLMLRDELKVAVSAVAQRTHVASRLANAVLGHLNTAVRLLAGAAAQAGVYTKQGMPQVTGRIGVMEAIG